MQPQATGRARLTVKKNAPYTALEKYVGSLDLAPRSVQTTMRAHDKVLFSGPQFTKVVAMYHLQPAVEHIPTTSPYPAIFHRAGTP